MQSADGDGGSRAQRKLEVQLTGKLENEDAAEGNSEPKAPEATHDGHGNEAAVADTSVFTDDAHLHQGRDAADEDEGNAHAA